MGIIVGIIVIVLAICVVSYAVSEIKYRFAKVKNTVKSWASDTEGRCIECRHCRTDNEYKCSDTGYFCVLSNCADITGETTMGCFEKPKVTEKDLESLFALGIWTEEGMDYIEESILGKAMTYSEVDAFLTELPKKYPHYIDPEYIRKNQ